MKTDLFAHQKAAFLKWLETDHQIAKSFRKGTVNQATALGHFIQHHYVSEREQAATLKHAQDNDKAVAFMKRTLRPRLQDALDGLAVKNTVGQAVADDRIREVMKLIDGFEF